MTALVIQEHNSKTRKNLKKKKSRNYQNKMNEILQFLPNTRVHLKTETELFVLINNHKKSGKSFLDKLFSKHENRLPQMYTFVFHDKSYSHVQNDKKTKYVCVVFPLLI